MYPSAWDASRPNPLADEMPATERTRDWGTRGLTVEGRRTTDILIATSTAPGAQTQGDPASPYVDALCRRLAQPNTELSQVFRLVRDDVRAATDGAQVPWESSSLGGDGIYIAGERP